MGEASYALPPVEECPPCWCFCVTPIINETAISTMIRKIPPTTKAVLDIRMPLLFLFYRYYSITMEYKYIAIISLSSALSPIANSTSDFALWKLVKQPEIMKEDLV